MNLLRNQSRNSAHLILTLHNLKYKCSTIYTYPNTPSLNNWATKNSANVDYVALKIINQSSMTQIMFSNCVLALVFSSNQYVSCGKRWTLKYMIKVSISLRTFIKTWCKFTLHRAHSAVPSMWTIFPPPPHLSSPATLTLLVPLALPLENTMGTKIAPLPLGLTEKCHTENLCPSRAPIAHVAD